MFYGANKEITAKLIADITGDSSSKNLMNLHLESMLEDITDILDVSQEKTGVKKTVKRKFGKAGVPKGRMEKAKKGIIKIHQKPKKKNINKTKLKNKRNKKKKRFAK